jgi:type IV pilus assembly protein PilQ
MEDLVNKKVTIELDNAGVKELVQVLSQVDGLNIIADDALEAESNLTINVRNVPLKEVLSYIARNMGVAFHLGENMIWVTQSLEEPGTGPKLETRLFQLRQGFIPSIPGGAGAQEDTDLEDALDAVLADSPEGASFRVFKTRNVLMVRDTIENLRLVEEMINTFDKPPYQVSIEARFLTISRDDLRDVGSEFAVFADAAPVVGDANAQMQVTSLLSTLGALASTDADGNVSVSTENGAAVGSFGGVIGNRAYSLLISALDKKNSTKNLSAPRVTVLNNRTAQIRRGSKILYYSELETVASNGGEETGNGNVQTALTGDPEELELGVTLGVKVNVGNDGNTILLGLYPEVVELLRWRAFNVVADGGTDSNNNDNGDSDTSGSGTIELPETSESYVQTAVRVKNGQTVALGGLVSSNTSKTVSKVPILGDIPLLGFFFRHTNETTEPQHLLIFVTAKVIDENGSSVQVAE